MDRALIKKLKTTRILSIISLFVEIVLFIFQPSISLILIILLYAVFIWNNSSSRETIIKILFIIISLLLLLNLLISKTNSQLNLFFLEPISQTLTDWMSLIVLAGLIYFLKSLKNSKRILKILLLIYTGMFCFVILIKLYAIAQDYNNILILPVVIISIIVMLPVYISQSLLLFIMQQSTNPVFYNSFIRENPGVAIRKAKNHQSEDDNTV